MIRNVSGAMVQHRHVVLMLGLLVAGVNAAAVGFVPTLGQRLFFPLLFLTLAVLILALIAMGIRPVYFVVEPQIPAFATPAPAWKVFVALGFLAPASTSIGALVRSTRAGIASTSVTRNTGSRSAARTSTNGFSPNCRTGPVGRTRATTPRPNVKQVLGRITCTGGLAESGGAASSVTACGLQLTSCVWWAGGTTMGTTPPRSPVALCHCLCPARGRRAALDDPTRASCLRDVALTRTGPI